MIYFWGRQKALESWVADIKKQALPIQIVLKKMIHNHCKTIAMAGWWLLGKNLIFAPIWVRQKTIETWVKNIERQSIVL